MTLLDLSQTAFPAQIQANLIAYMRLFAGVPGMYMRDDNAFWFISNQGAPGDTILRADWPGEEAEQRIDELFAQVGQHLGEIGWMVFPGDRPVDLGRRLVARGLPEGRAGNWLWADLSKLGPAPAALLGFHIEPVRDDYSLAAWVRASEAGFGGELGCFYDAYARHGYGPGAYSLHYIGYLGDTPVTSGTLLDAGGTAALYDISTPPHLRGQGFGGVITHFMMEEIRKRGYQETWIWSSDLGHSVYQKLGYQDADFGVREYHWQKE